MDMTACYAAMISFRELAPNMVLTHKYSQRPKAAWQFGLTLAGECIVGKIFEGEMFFGTLPTTLFKTYFEIMQHFRVIAKGIKDPEDNCESNSQTLMG